MQYIFIFRKFSFFFNKKYILIKKIANQIFLQTLTGFKLLDNYMQQSFNPAARVYNYISHTLAIIRANHRKRAHNMLVT